MRPKMTILLILITCHFYGYCQKDLYMGITGGPGTTFGQLDFNTFQNLNQKRAYAFPAGIEITYSGGEKVSVSTGLLRIFKQYRLERKNNLNNVNISRFTGTYDSWSIPLTLKYSYKIPESPNTSLMADIGFSFDLYDEQDACSNGSIISGSDSTTAESYHLALEYKSKYNVSLLYGVGLEKQFGNNSMLSIVLRYSQGLMRLMDGNYQYWPNQYQADLPADACDPPVSAPPGESYTFHNNGDYVAIQLTYKLLLLRKENALPEE